MKNRQTVAAFDFDGTLTVRDTLFEFIKFVCGSTRLDVGLALCSPVLAAYVLHLGSNSFAKEHLFSCFFKGMKYERFRTLGEDFARRVDEIKRVETIEALRRHVAEGHRTYVVSASIEEWVRPWCKSAGVEPEQVEMVRGVLQTLPTAGDGCFAMAAWREGTRQCLLMRATPEEVKGLAAVGKLAASAVGSVWSPGSGFGEELPPDEDDDDDDEDDDED